MGPHLLLLSLSPTAGPGVEAQQHRPAQYGYISCPLTCQQPVIHQQPGYCFKSSHVGQPGWRTVQVLVNCGRVVRHHAFLHFGLQASCCWSSRDELPHPEFTPSLPGVEEGDTDCVG